MYAHPQCTPTGDVCCSAVDSWTLKHVSVAISQPSYHSLQDSPKSNFPNAFGPIKKSSGSGQRGDSTSCFIPEEAKRTNPSFNKPKPEDIPPEILENDLKEDLMEMFEAIELSQRTRKHYQDEILSEIRNGHEPLFECLNKAPMFEPDKLSEWRPLIEQKAKILLNQVH